MLDKKQNYSEIYNPTGAYKYRQKGKFFNALGLEVTEQGTLLEESIVEEAPVEEEKLYTEKEIQEKSVKRTVIGKVCEEPTLQEEEPPKRTQSVTLTEPSPSLDVPAQEFILPISRQPYKTNAVAQSMIKRKNLDASVYEVVNYKTGFAITRI